MNINVILKMYITQLRRTTMDCYYEMDDGTDFEFKGWKKYMTKPSIVTLLY